MFANPRQVELMILGVLCRRGDQSAAQLCSAVGVGTAKLYPALQQLEINAEVDAVWDSN